jgi:hypothetical protein
MFKHFIRAAIIIVALVTIVLPLRSTSAASIYAYWLKPNFLHCDNDSVAFEYYKDYSLPKGTHNTFEFYLNGNTMASGVEETGPYFFSAQTAIGYGWLPVAYPYSFRFVIKAYGRMNNLTSTSIIDGRCLDEGKGVLYDYQY